MAEVIVHQIVEAPLADVWASWDAFADIAKFNPLLKDSYLMARSAKTGLGAERQCDFSDGKNYIREKIIGYVPQSHLVLEIYEGTVPVNDAVATLEFSRVDGIRSRVTMRMAFKPKMGVIGWLMLPVMKKQFAKMLGRLLAGNASYVEGLRRRAAA